MKLKEYLRLIRRNVALLVIATVLGGAAGFGIWALLPTTYSSRTELFASVSTSGDPYQLQMASSFMQERIQTYVDMASSRPVLEPVIDRLNLDETPEELAGQVNSYSDPRTVLITVEAAAATPAVPATVPDGLPLWMCIGLGLPVGLAIGLGIALLRSNLDSRLRTKEDVEAITSATVLASIPTDPKITDQPLLTQMGLDNVRGEAYRRLRTNLGFAQVDDTNSAILITSAGAQEGKSTTSINLAIALAQAGSRVALVDVDLRQPTVAEKLGLENSVGLTTALVGSADLSELMQPWGQDELYVLTAGMMPPNPTELLDSRAMGTLIKRLTGEFDIVILDGPPLLPVADSLVLSKQVGRVLLVASVGQVRTNDLQEAVRSLDVLDVPVDVVLNRVPRTSAETNGYYQCYSSRAQKQTAGPGPEIPSDVPPSDVPRTWPGSTEDAWSGRGSEQTAEAASPTWTTSDDATAGRHLRPRRLARTGAQTRRESMGRLP